MSDVDYFIKYVSMNSFMGHLTESHMRQVRAKFSNEDYTEPKSITSSSFKQIEFHTQLSSWSMKQWETDFKWEGGQKEFIHLPSLDKAFLLSMSKIKRNCVALRSMYYNNQKY